MVVGNAHRGLTCLGLLYIWTDEMCGPLQICILIDKYFLFPGDNIIILGYQPETDD